LKEEIKAGLSMAMVLQLLIALDEREREEGEKEEIQVLNGGREEKSDVSGPIVYRAWPWRGINSKPHP
jgi:hypothetical protein